MKPTPLPQEWRRRDACIALAAATLAGCATRDTPPRRLYGLTGTPPLPADARPGQDGRAWVLSPHIALPELLDRDEILVAEGSAGLRPWPEARWAEPLREALPRVLAEDLWRLRQPYPVTLGSKAQPTSGAESLRLIVQVDEWLARDDGAGLQLKLRARWHWAPLHAPAGTALPAPGSADLKVACSAQADALAGAYRLSVMTLAARIVATS
ncbi:MAG: membrane integrity-associated transporter subunit PqiC [Burkholderiales bacterium]|nr:membrane integrity-associated transporter subunit PqiC [Burkholderiales bacterium]